MKSKKAYFKMSERQRAIFNVFGFRLTLEVENFQFDSLVYFAEDENFSRNVLGRHGFLELVKLGLIDYEGKLYLSRYSE